jgi:Uma2 family endonuclease
MATIAAPPDLVLRSPDASWNRARWEQLEADGRRYEVIDGVLYMTTAPSSFHQWIIRQIVRTLFEQIDDTGIGVTTWAPIGLFMPHCDPVQPDIVVVRTADLGVFQERRIFGVPALLIEVLSPSNPEQDTQIKRSAYARAGVPEYWIVRPASQDILVCSRPDAMLGDYAQSEYVASDGVLTSPTLPVSVAIAMFFAGAPDTSL